MDSGFGTFPVLSSSNFIPNVNWSGWDGARWKRRQVTGGERYPFEYMLPSFVRLFLLRRVYCGMKGIFRNFLNKLWHRLTSGQFLYNCSLHFISVRRKKTRLSDNTKTQTLYSNMQDKDLFCGIHSFHPAEKGTNERAGVPFQNLSRMTISYPAGSPSVHLFNLFTQNPHYFVKNPILFRFK
jgi:hypothetical protein